MKESLALKNKGFWVSPCLLRQWRLQQAELPVDTMLPSTGSPQNLPASMLSASTLPRGGSQYLSESCCDSSGSFVSGATLTICC